MKKYLAILIVVTLLVSMFALCACDDDGLALYVPDGAPALSVAKIISDGKIGDSKVKTTVTKGGDEIVVKCASGEADLAVLPTNAAVNVMKKNSDYLMFTVNVYGVLYVVGTEKIDSISDLQGKLLYSIGKSNTPELVFNTICDNSGVSCVEVADNEVNNADAVNIWYRNEASDIMPLVLDKENNNAKFALLGEPAVTQLKNNAQKNNITIYDLFDLQELWQEVTGSDELGYPQASLIVKKDLLTDEFAAKLLETLQANYEFATTHLTELNSIMRGAGSSLNLNYTSELLERCNLTAIPAKTALSDINTYLAKFNLQLDESKIYEANN